MYLKSILFGSVLLTVVLSSCGSAKEITIPLTVTPGLQREMGQNASPTRVLQPDSTQKALAASLGLEQYVFTYYLHRPWERYYQEWKEGKRDSASVRVLFNRFEDNPSIPEHLPELDSESLFLFGRRGAGTYIVIADENNNNSLLDDSVRTVQPILEKSTEAMDTVLSTVHIDNLQGFYKGKVFTFSSTINLRPTLNIDSTKTPASQMYLNFLSSETFTGTFRYKGKAYKVATRNTMHPLRSNKQRDILVKFADAKEDSAFLKRWDTRPEYHSGDTVVLSKHVFKISETSPLLTHITLKPLKTGSQKVSPKQNVASSEPMGSQKTWLGKKYPSFTIPVNPVALSSDSLKGKVVFINFWFEACPPCVAEFEALSQMYDRLKDKRNFAFVSLTFESPQTIEKVKRKYGLSFPVYSISREECQRLNFNNGYPTNIIIDKKGIIQHLYVGGETSREQAKLFIDKEIYSRILKDL